MQPYLKPGSGHLADQVGHVAHARRGSRGRRRHVVVSKDSEHPTHLHQRGTARGLYRGESSLRRGRLRRSHVMADPGLDGDNAQSMGDDIVQLAGDA